MADSADRSDPVQIAAEIAPELDRARLAVVAFLRESLPEVAAQYGLAPSALQTLGMLRNTLPDRSVRLDDVMEMFIYSPPDPIRESVEQLAAAGVVEVADGSVAVSELGREIVHLVFGRTQQHLDEIWGEHTDLAAHLFPLADRACANVATTGGAAVRVVAPPYDPPGASLALKLAERLTPLRFHRFDAHVEAWRNDGLTVEEIQALAPGPQLDRIEAETNRWAAAPYCALQPAERLELLNGLRTLPA